MTPLLLIPGMMCDARLFAAQTAALSDRPCHVPLPVGADSMAALARAILDGAPARFDLLGLSLGGIVAMAVLATAPERVRRLVLIATNARAETAQVAASRVPQMDAVRDGDLARVMREEAIPLYGAAGGTLPAIAALALEMARTLGPEVFLSQSRALITRPDFRDTLAGFGGPSLVLGGAQDRLCPPFRHEEMAGLLPHARLEILPRTGHLPVLERPVEVSALLRGFLGP